MYRLVAGATVVHGPEANSGANSNVTSVNNDVAAVKIQNRKENIQIPAIHSLLDLIWCSHGVPIGQSHRFEVCTRVQHKSGTT